MRLGLLTAFSLLFILPLAVAAQSLGGLGGVNGEAFSVSVNPQYPSPYGKATISLLSSSLDLTNATLTVSLRGKELYKGAVRPVSIPLGAAGSLAIVKVVVASGGASYAQTVSVQPEDVVLVAEPLSSAPPLYPGKPLVPIEGSVRVVAVANLRGPDGKASDASSYAYSWTVDDTRIANSSGIGKSSIVVASPLQYRARDVSVVVTSQNGTLVGGSSLSLSAVEPSMRIYENSPLLGIRYDRALAGSFNISGAESTLYAAPFSLPTTNGAPQVEWFLNSSRVQTGNSVTLRPTGSGGGSASLSLVASGGERTTVTTDLSVVFGAKSGTNFFGL
jgi:hypothetical protein